MSALKTPGGHQKEIKVRRPEHNLLNRITERTHVRRNESLIVAMQLSTQKNSRVYRRRNKSAHEVFCDHAKPIICVTIGP